MHPLSRSKWCKSHRSGSPLSFCAPGRSTHLDESGAGGGVRRAPKDLANGSLEASAETDESTRLYIRLNDLANLSENSRVLTCARGSATNYTVKLQSLCLSSSSVDGLHGDRIEESSTSNSFCMDRSRTCKRNPLTNPTFVSFAKSGSSPELHVSSMMDGRQTDIAAAAVHAVPYQSRQPTPTRHHRRGVLGVN